MDATLMYFPDNSFDIVIDKGTLDALVVKNCFTYFNTFNLEYFFLFTYNLFIQFQKSKK